MTCIAGIEHEGKVYLCGDSAGCDGWNISTQAAPKVFRVGEFIIGGTGSFRMMQLLQYQLSVKAQEQESDTAYMITVFAEAVRELLKEHGFSKIENNTEEGGFFLVGYRGHLYQIQSDFSLLHNALDFDAVGCGAPYAKGALDVLDRTEPRAALLHALETSARFSNGVRGPFHCEVL